MSKATYVLFVDSTFRLGIRQGETVSLVNVDAAIEQMESAAERIRAELNTHSYDGEGVVLALGSPWCLSAAIDTGDLPRQHRRQAMIYRFEQRLPLAAEELTVDFTEHKAAALGVAVETARIRPLIDALEERGVPIEAVVPQAWLSLASESLSDRPHDTLFSQRNGAIDILEMKDARPLRWQQVPSKPDDWQRRLALATLTSAPTPGACETSEAHNWRGHGQNEELFESDNGAIAFRSASEAELLEAAVHNAPAYLDGRIPWLVNLRRDQLVASDPWRMVRRSINVTLLAFMLFAVSVVGAALYRQQLYEAMIAEDIRQQNRTFIDATGSRRVPTDPLSRLRSEERRLEAMTGQSKDVPVVPPALLVLRESLARLPDHLRFYVLEIRIEDEQLFLDGHARAHSDVDAIAAGLRARGGFEVLAPRIERLSRENGVHFSLQARFSPRTIAADDERGQRP